MRVTLGLFGKLPTENDFVRLHAAADPFGDFDHWLVDRVEWAHARGADAWRSAFRTGNSYAFVYRAPGRYRLAPLLVVKISNPPPVLPYSALKFDASSLNSPMDSTGAPYRSSRAEGVRISPGGPVRFSCPSASSATRSA